MLRSRMGRTSASFSADHSAGSNSITARSALGESARRAGDANAQQSDLDRHDPVLAPQPALDARYARAAGHPCPRSASGPPQELPTLHLELRRLRVRRAMCLLAKARHPLVLLVGRQEKHRFPGRKGSWVAQTGCSQASRADVQSVLVCAERLLNSLASSISIWIFRACSIPGGCARRPSAQARSNYSRACTSRDDSFRALAVANSTRQRRG